MNSFWEIAMLYGTFLLMIFTAYGWPVALSVHLNTLDVAPLKNEKNIVTDMWKKMYKNIIIQISFLNKICNCMYGIKLFRADNAYADGYVTHGGSTVQMIIYYA